jgi:hypothetical protein
MKTKKETQGEAAARLGISRQALSARLRNGWSRKKAFSTGAQVAHTTFSGPHTITAKCAAAGISQNTYYDRIRRGLSKKKALKPKSAVSLS